MHPYKGTTGRQNLGSRAHKSCFCTRPSRSRLPHFLPRRFQQAQKETATHTHTQSPSRRPYVARQALIGNVWVNAAGGPRPRCAQNAHAQLPHGFRLTDDYTGLDQCLTPLSKPHEFSRLLGAFELEKGHYLGPWRTCSLSTEHRREGFSQCRDVSAVESVFSQPKLVCFSSSLGVWECICSARVRGVCVLLGCMSLSPPTRHSARAH